MIKWLEKKGGIWQEYAEAIGNIHTRAHGVMDSYPIAVVWR